MASRLQPNRRVGGREGAGVYIAEGELGGSTGQPKNFAGTDGSNPSPSSGESRANLIFGRTPSMTGRFRSAQPNEGERDDRLDARVPIHRLQGGDECVALELGVARIIVVAGARTAGAQARHRCTEVREFAGKRH